MKKNIVFFIFPIFFIFYLLTQKISIASTANNPVLATISYVQSLFQLNQTDIDLLKARVDTLEAENTELRNTVETLENNTLPKGKWVHVCFDVATANLSVMKNGTCFPHVHWKVFVQCFPGTPCVPDNPADSYFVPPQEQ